jgi:hypothetical protein
MFEVYVKRNQEVRPANNNERQFLIRCQKIIKANCRRNNRYPQLRKQKVDLERTREKLNQRAV